MKFNISQDMKTGQWVVINLKKKTKTYFNNLTHAHYFVVQQIKKA